MARDETNADDDDSIRPDSVTAGNGGGDGGFGLDALAERAVEVVLDLLARANTLARGVLIFAVVTCVGGYLLGVAALGGGLRTFWIIVGGMAAAWAIGSVVAAMFRLWAVRKGNDLMVQEFRSLIGNDNRSERTVIETVEATETSDDGIVSMSRQFFSLRDVVNDHRSDFTQLTSALTSVTTLPGAMALAIVIGSGFIGLSGIFALILVF